MGKIDHHQVKDDDEWIQFAKEMRAYVETDVPEDVKKLFYPLGYLEMTSIIIDGIIRWRNSICMKCKKQEGYEKWNCSIYQNDESQMQGIPNEIWANENAMCPYYEAKIEYSKEKSVRGRCSFLIQT